MMFRLSQLGLLVALASAWPAYAATSVSKNIDITVSGAAPSCGPDAAPAPAVAHGLTCEVFHDDFTSSSTVDLGHTHAPGFKWYLQRCCGAPELNSADITFVAGGMQLKPSSALDPGDLYNMGSCFITGGTPGPGALVGTAIGGSMYVQITITALNDPGGTRWWPALWTLGEFQVGASPTPTPTWYSPEVDFLEHLGGGRNLHYWVNGDGVTGSFVEFGGFTPGSLNPGDSIGALILRPEDNGGTGFALGYVNDVADAHAPATWIAPASPYSNTAVTPMCFLLTTGLNQPLVLRSFKVFQAPSGPPPGGWTLISQTSVGATGTDVTTPAIDTTGADLIVIVQNTNLGNSSTGMVDSKGNTYVQAIGTGTLSNMNIWYVHAPTVGAGHTFTGHAASGFFDFTVQAWSGSRASPLDQLNHGSGTTTAATGSITPTINNELLITGVNTVPGVGGTSNSINGGFTVTASGEFWGTMAYLIQTTATAANPTWTNSTGGTALETAIVSFKGP
jgi:hypothetical protein